MQSFLTPLTEPIGAIWFIMVAIAIYWAARRQWKVVVSLGIPVLLLLILGGTPLPAALVAAKEKPYAKPFPAAPADVVVVLGGGVYTSEHDLHGLALSGAASRLVTGAELARQGLATNLVLGGSIPVEGKPTPLALNVQRLVESWNLAGVGVTNLGTCRDTHDEAVAFKKMQQERGWQRVYLVTSALHMPRSVAVFEKQGIHATPVACDYQAEGTIQGAFSIIPCKSNLLVLSLYTHECVGWWVYKLRGWL